MTLLEINETMATIEEMRAEITEKRERGATHLLVEIETLDLLVRTALGIVQLDEVTKKLTGKVKR